MGMELHPEHPPASHLFAASCPFLTFFVPLACRSTTLARTQPQPPGQSSACSCAPLAPALKVSAALAHAWRPSSVRLPQAHISAAPWLALCPQTKLGSSLTFPRDYMWQKCHEDRHRRYKTPMRASLCSQWALLSLASGKTCVECTVV